MTGLVENGTRIAGLDQDSIAAGTDGSLEVTLISYAISSRAVTSKVTADLEVDCTKEKFQQVRLTIAHQDGRHATILSRGPDWDDPANATDAALLQAACARNLSGLTDLKTDSPDHYAANYR